MSEVIAWLIERTDNGYPEWIAKYSGDHVTVAWTTDANAAQRFASKEQLEAALLLHYLEGKPIRGAVATEHMWCPSRTPIGTSDNAKRAAMSPSPAEPQT